MPSKSDTASRRKIFCVCIIALSASTSACSSDTTKSGTPSTIPTAIQRTATSKATFGDKGAILSLPNTINNIQSIIPRELSSIKRWTDPFANPREEQFYAWDLFTASHARTLKTHLRKMKNAKEVKEVVTHERSKMANYTRETKRERLVTGSPRPIKGLGGECLSFPIERSNAAPMSGGNGTRYSVSGVRMYCGVMNVGVSIQWEGMDYPSPGVTDRGKGLSYKAAEKQAIEIMKPIIFSLTPER